MRFIVFGVAVYNTRPLIENRIALHEVLLLTTMERRYVNSLISGLAPGAYCYFASWHDIKIQDRSVAHADKIYVLGQKLQRRSYERIFRREFVPCVYPVSYGKKISRKYKSTSTSKVIFWHVANALSYLKGTFDLLSAWDSFARDDGIHLYVIGASGDFDLCDFQHYDNVSFTGPLDWSLIAGGEFLPPPNFFVAPSHAEGLQGALWEAAYMGARLIVSDSCGLDLDSFQQHVTMFPKGDIAALRSCISGAITQSLKSPEDYIDIASKLTGLSEELGVDLLLTRHLKTHRSEQ
jgi:hypothetical protein